MRYFRGRGQILTFIISLWFWDFSLCNLRDLIYAQTACNSPKTKENLKSHHICIIKRSPFCINGGGGGSHSAKSEWLVFFHKLELRTAALMSELMINRPYICAAQEKWLLLMLKTVVLLTIFILHFFFYIKLLKCYKISPFQINVFTWYIRPWICTHKIGFSLAFIWYNHQ